MDSLLNSFSNHTWILFLLVLPGIVFLLVLILGVSISWLDRLRLGRRYRFLSVAPPFPPLDARESRRLDFIRRLTDEAIASGQCESVASRYLDAVNFALMERSPQSVRQLVALRYALIRELTRGESNGSRGGRSDPASKRTP